MPLYIKQIHMKLRIFILSLVCLSNTNLFSQHHTSGIPFLLEVCNHPGSYTIDHSAISISAEGKTNLFNSPGGANPVQNAPMILFKPDKDFTLTAKVTGELKSIYDVAALVVYDNGDVWAKLCYENSVEKESTIVSVVTRKYSDDSNSVSAGAYAYLSVVKKGKEFSFFYSPDNENWKMIRHFHLNVSDDFRVGFAAHGSRGDGFTGIFSEIKYIDRPLENMRGT